MQGKEVTGQEKCLQLETPVRRGPCAVSHLLAVSLAGNFWVEPGSAVHICGVGGVIAVSSSLLLLGAWSHDLLSWLLMRYYLKESL